jgi:hypothetical protein
MPREGFARKQEKVTRDFFLAQAIQALRFTV